MKRLFKAVRQNDLETIKRILDANPELINCVATPPPKKDDGQSLLQVANKVGNLEIAHYLIEMGIDVNYMEPDNGLPWPRSFRCPVLIDAVRFLLSGGRGWKKDVEGRMKLIQTLLEKGADPNKTDNGNRNSWDWAIQAYLDAIDTVGDDEQKEQFMTMAKELFGILYYYNADILTVDRVNNELLKNYSLFLNNLILNRDFLYGVAPEKVEFWKRCWSPIVPLIKSFYMKNNPYYESVE